MMGDIANHFDPLKKLGCFETSNQWILYDDRFQKFFDFLTQNITEINVFTEHEALERNEIDDLDKFDELEEKQKLEEHVPGILKCTENEAVLYKNEISAYSDAEQDYKQMVEFTRSAKSASNARLSELEDKQSVLITQEKEMLSVCYCQAKQLEMLQEENMKLYMESRNCFTKVLSPPLLFSQLPLEQYFTKCDSFLQYFTLYVQENYKIQDFLKFETESEAESETEELSKKLKSLKDLFTENFQKLIDQRIQVRATQAMIDGLDVKEIHAVNFNDLERELYELEVLTENHLKVANETLRNDLNALVQQKSQQRIELVLYENTKNKLERALKRLENGKCLTKIASDALSNAELIWIAIQFDLERSGKRIDNIKQLTINTQASWRRIKAMQSLNARISNSNHVSSFLATISDLLAKSSNGMRIENENEGKACLYEYEKFCRLLTYALHNMLNGRAYKTSKDQLKELKRLESLLEPLIYDSPIDAPVLFNVKLHRLLFDAKTKRNRIELSLRQLRSQYQMNIVERMEKEPFWRASEMLWIWFLKQPKRLLLAIEEVKREASNIPAWGGAKNLSGIKRK